MNGIARETKARRAVERARETLVHDRRLFRACFAVVLLGLAAIPGGIALAYVANGVFVVMSIVAFIVTAIFGAISYAMYDRTVRRSRSALREAEWAYEDAILGGGS